MRDHTPGPPADAELQVAALRYAAAVMPPAEAEGFEARLAEDQTARDALAEAVRLSAAASGAPALAPDPLVRKAVAERLHPTWLSRLFPRRPYRGHPAVWAGLGGGIAAAVAVTVAVGGFGGSSSSPTACGPESGVFPIRIAAEATPPQEAEETPARSKLNPMGLDKRVADTTAAGPSPMAVPATSPVQVPMPMPAARVADDKVAEGPNDPNPMGDPAVGMMTSKL